MAGISKAEYARRRGVDAALITRWAKAGRLVIEGGLVNAEASDALLATTLDPTRGGRGGSSGQVRPRAVAANAAPPAPTGPTYNSVRTFREGFNAKTAEATYRKLIGELVEREPYNRALIKLIQPSVQRLFSMSARIGARVAAESDVRKCQDLIDDEAHSIAQEIADMAQSFIERGDKTQQ